MKPLPSIYWRKIRTYHQNVMYKSMSSKCRSNKISESITTIIECKSMSPRLLSMEMTNEESKFPNVVLIQSEYPTTFNTIFSILEEIYDLYPSRYLIGILSIISIYRRTYFDNCAYPIVRIFEEWSTAIISSSKPVWNKLRVSLVPD